MGVFRGITADEESVAGIFRALQARQYPSGRLKTGLDFGYLEQALETLS
jgi:hypothetical protein